MEHPEQPDPVSDLENFFNLSFDRIGRDQLRQIALWARVCSITSLVGYMIQLYLWFFGHSRTAFGFGNGVIGVMLNLVAIGGGGTFNYFLYRFAVAVSRGVQNTDAYHVNSGFNNLRMYFKIFAIVIIIGLCVFFLAVVDYLLTDARFSRINY